jgi:predicted AlkP superfamily phosphohydrolase/phosphomutase
VRFRALSLVVVVASTACPAARLSTETLSAPARRVVFVSFDAGADWIVDRLIAEGKAPALARVAQEGASADSMVSVIPSLTAVAHASLWTGAFPRGHGATGNSMPIAPTSEHTLLEHQSGYLSGVLRAEPIWETAARHGRRVLVIQATNGYPFSGRYPDRLTQFDIYANELLHGEVVAGVLGDTPLTFAIGDVTARVTRGAGISLAVSVGETHLTLDPGTAAFSPPVAVPVNGVTGYLRIGVLEYDRASGRVLLIRGDVVRLASTSTRARDELLADAGVTLGEGATSHYQAGRFGKPLAQGGNGSAERHLVASTLANQAYFDGALRYAARQPWDLLVTYVPNMDIAGHALAGMLDPDTPGHDPALAARIWPVYEELFRRCVDDHVAAIRRLFPDAAVAIGADHGVEGNLRVWYPNVVLREAGLLAENLQGGVDLARSKALFLYSHSGGVFLNSARYRQGIVAEEQRSAVKAAVRTALLSARDPDTGTPLARAVIDADLDGDALGIGGDLAPDVYFDPTPGYYTSALFGQKAAAKDLPPVGHGAHGPFPSRRRLHGIFYAVGPGVRAGARLGIVRQVDAAPTVASLLGIPPPAQSVGRALPVR